MSIDSPQRWRILNVESSGYAAEARELLCRIADVDNGDCSREELLARVAGYDAIIVRLRHHIDAAVLRRAVRLAVIVSATTGLDHIDVDEARRRGVAVLSLRGEHAFLDTITATAEHTWALLLALVRRLPAAVSSVQRGQWNRDAFVGRELAGLSLGIIGLGRIGRQVANFAQAFRMTVCAFDPYTPSWSPGVERCDSLTTLLRRSAIVSLHVPLTPETHRLIDEDALALLPDGALLINTARGEILDEAAVLAALQQGRLGGAALDVLGGEVSGAWRTSPLLEYANRRDNLIITPHIAGACHETMRKTEIFMAKKLVTYLEQRQKAQQ